MPVQARILCVLSLLLLASSPACESKPAGAEDAVQGGMLQNEVQKIQPVETQKIVAPDMIQSDQKIVAPDMIQKDQKIVAPDMVQKDQKIVAPDMIQKDQKIVAPDMIQGNALIGEDALVGEDGKQAISK
jgi:cytochrome c-type biogenesis protein CcmE